MFWFLWGGIGRVDVIFIDLIQNRLRFGDLGKLTIFCGGLKCNIPGLRSKQEGTSDCPGDVLDQRRGCIDPSAALNASASNGSFIRTGDWTSGHAVGTVSTDAKTHHIVQDVSGGVSHYSVVDSNATECGLGTRSVLSTETVFINDRSQENKTVTYLDMMRSREAEGRYAKEDDTVSYLDKLANRRAMDNDMVSYFDKLRSRRKSTRSTVGDTNQTHGEQGSWGGGKNRSWLFSHPIILYVFSSLDSHKIFKHPCVGRILYNIIMRSRCEIYFIPKKQNTQSVNHK